MNGLLLAALLAAPAASQSFRATGSAFCICPNGTRGHVGPGKAHATCESLCGDGGSSPGVDYGAIQRAQEAERLAREQREREAAEESARRARKAMEQREFEQKKAEALSSLKGVSTGEPTLKGVGAAPNGLKGVDSESGGVKLKGLNAPRGEAAAEEPQDKPKACRIVDTCVDALKTQTAALDAARRDQADLYMAMGTADMKHGWSQRGDLKTAPPDAPPFYVWNPDAKDAAGFPAYLRASRTTVDDISRLITAQRAAAFGGKYDPKKSGLLDSDSGEQLKRKLGIAKEQAENLKEFADYMRALKACADGRDADFNGCVKKATASLETALKMLDVKVDKATKARVAAAADAYTKYSGRVLDRAREAADAASRCFQGCK